MSSYTGGRIVPKHCGVWSSVKEYEMLSIVLYGSTGDSYMSRKKVPAGVDITDTGYWAFCADYSAQLSMIASDVDALEKDLKTLKEQVAANVTASTDADADYAAEVANARTDSEGETYDSLGEAIRSITTGLQPKITPSTTGVAVTEDSGNTAEIELIERTVRGTFAYHGTSYVGLFAGFFGTYEEMADKKIRIVLWCDTETDFTVLLTNAKVAWGSLDGSTTSLVFGSVEFTAENGYRASFDIDFSEDQYADFAAGLTEGHETLYFCLRKDGASAVGSGTVYFYAYEIIERRELLWKYVSLYDDLVLLQNEFDGARNDGTEYSTLQALLVAHRADIDAAIKELEDARTDSYDYTADTFAERLASVDTVVRPRLPISEINRPRDNSNGWLDEIEGAQMGAEIIRNNARFYFDYEAYLVSVTPAWGSVNFSFAVANEYMASLEDISQLYLSFKIEGMDDSRDLHVGDSMSLTYYINGYSSWGKTINRMTTSAATIGSTTLIELPEEYVQKVIDSGLPLFITFSGSFLNCTAVSDMGQVQMTASIVNKAAKGNLSAYTGYSEYAESAAVADKAAEADHAAEADEVSYAAEADHAAQADNAATADEAGYADTANLADNFFISTPDELLNVEGVRYSPYMDTADIPQEYPYSYKHGFQSCVQPYSVETVENGFSPMLRFSITLSGESSQTNNQGYVKNLSGMLTFEELYERLLAGYTTGYICEMEDCLDYPEGASEGSYPNVLLIYYYNDSTNTKVAHVTSFLSRKVTENLTLRVWKFTVDEETLAGIAAAKEAETFRTGWFGIWNTLKYEEEETAIWEPKWYWQDYAFTDGSFSDNEMLTFFQKKYTYWASYVNHAALKAKFAAIDASLEALENNLEDASGSVELAKDAGYSLPTVSGAAKATDSVVSAITTDKNEVTVTYTPFSTDSPNRETYLWIYWLATYDITDLLGKGAKFYISGTNSGGAYGPAFYRITGTPYSWVNTLKTVSLNLTEAESFSFSVDIDSLGLDTSGYEKVYLLVGLDASIKTADESGNYVSEYEGEIHFKAVYTDNERTVIATELVGFDPNDYYDAEKVEGRITEVEEEIEEMGTRIGDLTSIVCWGDSLTAGGGWTTTLQTLSGLTVYNSGTGGENARTIMARQGADVMLVNNIIIPAECEPVTIATRTDDTGITTQFGNKVTPLLQGGAHVNPVMIGDVEGTLTWTGSDYADTTGAWTFTRSAAGEVVEITRPTAVRTNFDRIHNGKDAVMIIFMGQNGGYSDVDDLVNMHRLMIDHFKGKEYLILGLSSGTASSRADYEAAMQEAFGRRFLSLREYLSTALYDEDGNIISCYGLDDQGLDMEETHTYNGTEYVTVDEIAAGTVPHQILSDSVHYTSGTKTVIGNLIYKRMVEQGIL